MGKDCGYRPSRPCSCHVCEGVGRIGSEGDAAHDQLCQDGNVRFDGEQGLCWSPLDAELYWSRGHDGFCAQLPFCVGRRKSDVRRQDLSKILNESSFGDDKAFHVFDSDMVILTGDLNSQVSEGVACDGSVISTEDELLVRMREDGPAFPFLEHPVQFPATYKLVPGEEGRPVFHGNRKPGWCDRVLYRSATNGATCVEYNSLRDVDMSDHTPVYALFSKISSAPVPAPVIADDRSAEFGIGDSVEDDNDSDLEDR